MSYLHHLPDPQAYAIDQERARHDSALYSFGEYAMFVLMWNIIDHEAGLVDRCPTCYEAYGSHLSGLRTACDQQVSRLLWHHLRGRVEGPRSSDHRSGTSTKRTT